MAIENLEPDLVILQTGAKQEDVDKLRDDGYKVLLLKPAVDRLSFRNLYACIGAAMEGARTGQEKGLAAAEKILISLDDIERLTLSENKVNTVIFTDEYVTKCVTGDDITSMCIDLAGGFNVNIDKTGSAVVIDDIALSNPGVILCLEGTEALLHSKRELGITDAFKNNRIYTYDVSKFNSLGSNLIVATWELARILHPDLITPDMLPDGAINYIVDNSIVTFEPAE